MKYVLVQSREKIKRIYSSNGKLIGLGSDRPISIVSSKIYNEPEKNDTHYYYFSVDDNEKITPFNDEIEFENGKENRLLVSNINWASIASKRDHKFYLIDDQVKVKITGPSVIDLVSQMLVWLFCFGLQFLLLFFTWPHFSYVKSNDWMALFLFEYSTFQLITDSLPIFKNEKVYSMETALFFSFVFGNYFNPFIMNKLDKAGIASSGVNFATMFVIVITSLLTIFRIIKKWHNWEKEWEKTIDNGSVNVENSLNKNQNVCMKFITRIQKKLLPKYV